jgi:phosphoglycerate dehydrogenase-like enzyme
MSPNIVLAHWPGLEVLTEADKDAFAEVGTLLNREPVSDWSAPEARELLAEAEVIVGHWGCPRIDAEVLDHAPKLAMVAYAAGTVKGTVADEVWQRGIRVTSGADANAVPVVDFTLAAILFANKNVLFTRDAMREPSLWKQRQMGDTPVGNFDKTIGVVGASLIGRLLIERLAPFDYLQVVLYDPFVTAEEATELGVTKVELLELCEKSHVVSVHAPLLDSTIGMIGAGELAAMATGSTIINTARGPIVDHDALTAEVLAGRLYAVLDVTDPEPLPDDHPLRTSPNAFITPHIAGTQGSELRRMAESVRDEIRRWSAGEPGANQIHREQLDRLA